MLQCIRTGYHWGGRRFIDNEEQFVLEMMGKWDSCPSYREIWGIEVEGVSVFYYNATLTPWFYGIDLVRFVNPPYAGRRLEIKSLRPRDARSNITPRLWRYDSIIIFRAADCIN